MPPTFHGTLSLIVPVLASSKMRTATGPQTHNVVACDRCTPACDECAVRAGPQLDRTHARAARSHDQVPRSLDWCQDHDSMRHGARGGRELSAIRAGRPAPHTDVPPNARRVEHTSAPSKLRLPPKALLSLGPPLPWPSMAFRGLPWPSMAFDGLRWPSARPFHGLPRPSTAGHRRLPKPLLSRRAARRPPCRRAAAAAAGAGCGRSTLCRHT